MTKDPNSQETAEFSRCLAVEDISKTHQVQSFEASRKENAAVAARLGVLEVEYLRLRCEHWRAEGMLQLQLRLSVRLSQKSVVTLEPVTQSIEEEVCLRFVESRELAEQLDEEKRDKDGDIVLSDDSMEPVEVVENGVIDAGELAVQYLALELDPYPREKEFETMENARDAGVLGALPQKGFSINEDEYGSEEEIPEKANPFAVLANLKNRK